MKHVNFVKLLLLYLVFGSALTGTAAIEFKEGNLEKVRKNAASEGKLYFVNFTAAWCSPCQIMKEYTFTDPSLSYYVRNNYLAAQVDIDNFDGVGYKQQYNITTLPTILVFNSKGEVVGRHEESLSATKMLNVLKAYDYPANRIKTVSAPVTTSKTGTISRPPLKASGKSKSTPKTQPASPRGNGLFLFDVKPKASTGFSVQIGVYADYENVLREVAKFKKLFNEPILVHIDKLKNKTVYRVMVGEFESASDAGHLIQKVKENGLEGFAKDLSVLK